uniref:Uncharacterized protein n=1 Tax=viral metagenome TaxID=1070528 RepID=A0A6C0I348_9ZZZZ
MPSVSVIVVEKNGTIKEVDLKKFDEEELFKKAGFKTKDGFKCHTQWAIPDLQGKNYNISVYGKTNGRANQENKYEFPPPIDTVLFFGNCILVNKVNDVVTSVSAKEWDNIYQFLYGGFEDIGDEDEEDDEEDDDDDGLPRTKSGYVKDDFIVDDDEEEDDDDESEEEEDDEEEEVVKKRPRKKVAATAAKKARNANVLSVFEVASNAVIDEANYLNCESELVEEEYV